MPLSDILEGERKLFSVLGANVTLGGVKLATKAHQVWTNVMPALNDILTVVQILVALATLVYMLFKIRKIARKGE